MQEVPGSTRIHMIYGLVLNAKFQRLCLQTAACKAFAICGQFEQKFVLGVCIGCDSKDVTFSHTH